MCRMAISSNLLSHDVVMTFDMFGNGMKNKIFGNFNTTNIVTIVDLGFKCLISLRSFCSQTIFLVPSINA